MADEADRFIEGATVLHLPVDRWEPSLRPGFGHMSRSLCGTVSGIVYAPEVVGVSRKPLCVRCNEHHRGPSLATPHTTCEAVSPIQEVSDYSQGPHRGVSFGALVCAGPDWCDRYAFANREDALGGSRIDAGPAQVLVPRRSVRDRA